MGQQALCSLPVNLLPVCGRDYMPYEYCLQEKNNGTSPAGFVDAISVM
jgi:hypothetical protein